MTLGDILNNPYIMPVIVAGVTALAAALGRVLVAQYRKIRQQLSADQAATIDALAVTAVKWVEQTTKPGTPSAKKLAQATEWVRKQAEARNIPVSEEFINAVVEAAVFGVTNPTLSTKTEPVPVEP